MSVKCLHIRAVLVLLLALSFGEVSGQQYPQKSYQESVDMQSLLYRGRVERRYAYRYQGTYFAYQDKYVKGEVYFNKRHYSDVLINLNSHRDRVSVTKSEGQLPVILDRRYVEWFKMGSRLFVNIENGKYYPTAENLEKIINILDVSAEKLFCFGTLLRYKELHKFYLNMYQKLIISFLH